MKRAVLLTLFATAAVFFAALGAWQLDRRAWKLDLIARVDARTRAPPVAAPAPAQWPAINARDHEYRRVRLTGRFEHDKATLVDALTVQGAGYWVLTPFVTPAGTVLVNRGFMPLARKQNHSRPGQAQILTGLMRMPEPGGRFLRANRPESDLWYSRDVTAIAARRELGPVAPFFVDQEKGPLAGYPMAGLTVVQFRNAHLVYAVTWFLLALMAGIGAWRIACAPKPQTTMLPKQDAISHTHCR